MMDELDLRKQLGSIEPFKFMKDAISEMERRWKTMINSMANFSHIRLTNIDDFKKSIEQYAEKHPNAEIKATGFVFSSEDDTKSEEYEYKSKK